MDVKVFANFSEYWHYAKHLTDKQRQALLRSLPKEQREKLQQEYLNEGWEDLFMRNKMDKILSQIEKEFGWNLIHVRCLVLKGRPVYVKRTFWEFINNKFSGFSARHIYYIFGGYRVVEAENASDEYKLIPVEEQ